MVLRDLGEFEFDFGYRGWSVTLLELFVYNYFVEKISLLVLSISSLRAASIASWSFFEVHSSLFSSLFDTLNNSYGSVVFLSTLSIFLSINLSTVLFGSLVSEDLSAIRKLGFSGAILKFGFSGAILKFGFSVVALLSSCCFSRASLSLFSYFV